MKRFKVEGWYRYNDEKDFESIKVEATSSREATDMFFETFNNYCFYLITAEEIE